MIRIQTLILLLFIGSASFAQKKWSDEEWKQFKAEKVSYITTTLELTPEEAQLFWPLYNQSEKERIALFDERRALDCQKDEEIKKMSDQKVAELTRARINIHEREVALEKKYNEKYLEVLPAHKVYQLYRVENQHRRNLLKKYRGNSNGKPNKE